MDDILSWVLEVRSVRWWLRVALGLRVSSMGVGNRCVTIQRVARWQVVDVHLCCGVEESFW